MQPVCTIVSLLARNVVRFYLAMEAFIFASIFLSFFDLVCWEVKLARKVGNLR